MAFSFNFNQNPPSKSTKIISLFNNLENNKNSNLAQTQTNIIRDDGNAKNLSMAMYETLENNKELYSNQPQFIVDINNQPNQKLIELQERMVKSYMIENSRNIKKGYLPTDLENLISSFTDKLETGKIESEFQVGIRNGINYMNLNFS